MENKIQTDLPSDISLHPHVKGEGSQDLSEESVSEH